MAKGYLCLGSNLGDRESNLRAALEALRAEVTIERLSSVYETEPVGYLEQPRFLNMVCSGVTGLDPLALLSVVKRIEASLGRVPSFRNGPRLIDIDILLYDDRVIATGELIIPHPRMIERAFVLVPLIEIAPELVHPATGQRISDLVPSVTNLREVRKWGDVSSIGAAAL